jgi:hypothetical protein
MAPSSGSSPDENRPCAAATSPSLSTLEGPVDYKTDTKTYLEPLDDLRERLTSTSDGEGDKTRPSSREEAPPTKDERLYVVICVYVSEQEVRNVTHFTEQGVHNLTQFNGRDGYLTIWYMLWNDFMDKPPDPKYIKAFNSK